VIVRARDRLDNVAVSARTPVASATCEIRAISERLACSQDDVSAGDENHFR
jgi:hypothetical protein